MTDFSHIRAGSLLKARGGFLMLHVRDLLADALVWEKLRRFTRSGRLQIEREVEMSGPIHDKGVLILHSYRWAASTRRLKVSSASVKWPGSMARRVC